LFYYYGRKKAHAKRYPRPEHDTIVEPFAGSAAYSLYGDHWTRRVILYDTSERVCRVWRYLFQASRADIRALPEPPPGADLHHYKLLSQAERELIGFHAAIGKPTPRSIVSEFNRWAPGKRYILDNLHKVQGGNWEIHHASYETCAFAGAATWFIDPPYKHAGRLYPGQYKLDYAHIAGWCLQRPGLVIVCGGANDDWLPFELLTDRWTKSAGLSASREGVFALRRSRRVRPPFHAEAGTRPARRRQRMLMVEGCSEGRITRVRATGRSPTGSVK
jgi:hypothetical protein